MPTTVLMPALSPTMTEGKLAKWHVQQGDTVAAGDLLAEIETDKAIMEFEAVDDGTVGRLLVEEGSADIEVNQPIAIMLGDDEDISALSDVHVPDVGSTTLQDDQPPATAQPALSQQVSPGRVMSVSPPPERMAGDAGRIFASPLARRLARENDLSLSDIDGTGPNGRIIKRDIELAIKEPPGINRAVAPAAAAASEVPKDIAVLFGDREFDEVALDGMRKTIAARLVEAKQTIPHFYLRREILLDQMLAVRSQINSALQPDGNRISVNDFMIKASALALQAVPDANSVWAHDRILRFKSSDVAVAVAVDGGLFTPVIRDAHDKSLPELSAEMRSLAEKARSRRLKPEEYTGGSFSISNLGMFGIESFDAVINPPHGSILAVGTGRRVPFELDDGTVEFRTSVSVTLSCDHRVIDGVLGASFLAEIARHLENPMLLFI